VLSRLMELKLRMVYLSDDLRKFFDSCNISIVSALFLVFIPVIQLKGNSLRVSATVQFNCATDHLSRRDIILSIKLIRFTKLRTINSISCLHILIFAIVNRLPD